MTNTYQFSNPNNTVAARSGDGASVPWSATASDGPLDQDGYVYRIWQQDGSPTPSAYVAPPAPPPSCQLWQLQAVMTLAQWTAVTNAVAALNNAAVSAFFAHGTNIIPANSTTLIALGEAIGLTADQVTTLVQEASAVSIP